MGLADLREQIQDDVITFFAGYESNIPFTFTDDEKDDMERELCQIVVNRINSHMEKENGEST
jgi:hypothetical protein